MPCHTQQPGLLGYSNSVLREMKCTEHRVQGHVNESSELLQGGSWGRTD